MLNMQGKNFECKARTRASDLALAAQMDSLFSTELSRTLCFDKPVDERPTLVWMVLNRYAQAEEEEEEEKVEKKRKREEKGEKKRKRAAKGSRLVAEKAARQKATEQKKAEQKKQKEVKERKKKEEEEEGRQLMEFLRSKYSGLSHRHGNDTLAESSADLVKDVKSWLPLQTLIKGKAQQTLAEDLGISKHTWEGLWCLNCKGTSAGRSSAVQAFWASGPRWHAVNRRAARGGAPRTPLQWAEVR
jgi:outer membrane biosynthesis protein TonB